MEAEYYFDDTEEGLTRETSHPRFRALAQDEFYYDCGDDFSPFGNLRAVCNAHVATAFGQLKITGDVNAEIRVGALAALACLVRINHLSRTKHPDWTHAPKNLERLLAMRHVLEAASS